MEGDSRKPIPTSVFILATVSCSLRRKLSTALAYNGKHRAHSRCQPLGSVPSQPRAQTCSRPRPKILFGPHRPFSIAYPCLQRPLADNRLGVWRPCYTTRVYDRLMTATAHSERTYGWAELTDIRVFVGLDYLSKLKVPCNNGHLGERNQHMEGKEGGTPNPRCSYWGLPKATLLSSHSSQCLWTHHFYWTRDRVPAAGVGPLPSSA